MNPESGIRLGLGLVGLLLYQWMLALGSVGYSCAAGVVVLSLPDWDLTTGLALFILLILACWGIAIGFASVEISRRRSRGLLVGMICHLILEVIGLPFMLVLVGLYFSVLLTVTTTLARGWRAYLCSRLWLPFVLISAWAFLSPPASQTILILGKRSSHTA